MERAHWVRPPALQPGRSAARVAHTHGTPVGITPRSGGTGYSHSTFSHRSCSQGSTAASGLGKKHVCASPWGPVCGWTPQEGTPLSHSPQLVLVIAQAQRQEGTAPKLQQPTVQLLGHKVEPWGGGLGAVERKAWADCIPGLEDSEGEAAHARSWALQDSSSQGPWSARGLPPTLGPVCIPSMCAYQACVSVGHRTKLPRRGVTLPPIPCPPPTGLAL